MAHPALEYAVALPAMLDGKEFEVVDCRDVQDCSPCPLLLVFAGDTGGKGLDGNAVSLTDFEVGCRRVVVRLDRNGAPWAVFRAVHVARYGGIISHFMSAMFSRIVQPR